MTKTTLERFKSGFHINKKGCWITKHPYATFRFEGETRTKYSVAYEIMSGERVRGHILVLDHVCDNPYCCNPFHLNRISQGENVSKGLRLREPLSHCPSGHLYSEENSYIYKGWIACKICRRNNVRKHREANIS